MDSMNIGSAHRWVMRGPQATGRLTARVLALALATADDRTWGQGQEWKGYKAQPEVLRTIC
jgi:hypothetical protein